MAFWVFGRYHVAIQSWIDVKLVVSLLCMLELILRFVLFPLMDFLQRVNQCLRDACKKLKDISCKQYIDCGHGQIDEYMSKSDWKNWTSNSKAVECFHKDGPFPYGIYEQAVLLSTKHSIVTRYIYSLFWGFQV